MRCTYRVELRSQPLYEAGSVGFRLVAGTAQLGELMESAWTLNETCRFRLRPDLSLSPAQMAALHEAEPPPAPDQAGAPEGLRAGVKRSASKASLDTSARMKEEAWSLKETFFLSKSPPNQHTGLVVLVLHPLPRMPTGL